MRLLVSTDRGELSELLSTYTARKQVSIQTVEAIVGGIFLPQIGFFPMGSVTSDDGMRLLNQVTCELVKQGLFVAEMGKNDELKLLHKPHDIDFRDELIREYLRRPNYLSVDDTSEWSERKLRSAYTCLAYTNFSSEIKPEFGYR